MPRTEERAGPGVVAAAACHEPFVEAWKDLGEDAENALLEVLRSGVERHRELIGRLELAGDAPENREELRERLVEYRRTLAAELLEPLARTFEHRSPSTAVVTHLQQAAEESEVLCCELPETVLEPWPEGALARKPSDGFRRRMGKILARVVSSARKAGRERPLPLRQVALRHLYEVVVPAQDEVGALGIRTWAAWSRHLELVWVEWGRTALPALVEAELDQDDQEDQGDEGDEGGEGGEDEEKDAWETLREAGAALQEGLEGLLAEHPHAGLATEARASLERARTTLEADLAVAGSFLLRPRGDPTVGRLRITSDLAPAGGAWDEAIRARLQMYHALLSTLSGSTAVQQRMIARIRERCLSDVTALTEASARLDGLCTELEHDWRSGDPESLLERLDDTFQETLRAALQGLPDKAAVGAAVEDLSDATVEALLAMVRQTPTSLVLHSVTAKPSSLLKAETRTVHLQELARQSFDALRIERVRSATTGLVEALESARSGVAQLDTVYSFARDEALRELEGDGADGRQRALDLVDGALRSVAEALRNHRTTLEAALVTAQDRLSSEIAEGSRALLERVGAGRMEARIFAARSRAAALRSWMAERWGPPLERASRWAMLRFTRLRRLSQRVFRKGRSIVGSAPSETLASSRTLKALADAHELTRHLPLVYQKLFTFQPVSDRALLAGRDVQLADAMRRWRRWHDADGVPLIVRGRQGNGITSFLNVLGAQIEADGGSVVHYALDERVTDEAVLAEQLSTTLDLPPAGSLDQLARTIFEAMPNALPSAVALDNLEHLYLRVPRGTDLVERLLTLMAETEPRVFWIGAVTSSAWQLIATLEPTAIAQIDVVDLPQLTADDLHEAIMVRHRRSGLAIRFEEPTSGRHLLRRRLRRMRDQKGHERLLEEDFFDRLHETSGGHLGLALWQWLMAADFETGEGVLMHQPEHLDFAILDALDLTQNFTLKAFLEHRSLTLGEHDRIFRLPRHESYQIFESLRNRHILEPLAANHEEIEERSEIEEDLRYAVRPLLTGAVLHHLQARNIVH